MKKHESILELISLLKKDNSISGLEVADFWDVDLCAIGFKRGEKLIYISTYAYTRGKFLGLYDAECELIDPDTFMPLSSLGMEEGLDFEELKERIKSHLFGE